MGYVSDEAVNAIIQELKMSREKRRSIQNMNKDELQRYLINLYREGFEDGAEALQRHLSALSHADDEGVEEVSIGWEDVLRVIADVKGMTDDMLDAIDKKLKETY